MSNNQIMKIFEEIPGEVQPPIVHEIDRRVLRIVRAIGPVTRSRLVSVTGIARSTLYDSLSRLAVKGYVTSYSEDRTHVRGRPQTFWHALEPQDK
ncbi:MAG: hypothetical protein JSV04_07555 [Candidatus Heimdallarchaeota archaeon]|nr:MAG: hypothetical protein JSV04_07555 [Candidatus Heimdallarchaeota archaeon]